MKTHTNNAQKNKGQSLTNEISQKQSISENTFQFMDNRPKTIVQRKLQEFANNYSAKQKQLIQKEENRESPLQLMDINKFKGLLEKISINGKTYTYDQLANFAENHPIYKNIDNYLDQEIEKASTQPDVETIIRNLSRDYRSSIGAKGDSGHYLKGGLPEDDYSHTDERGDQATEWAIKKLPNAPENPSSKYLTPGLNPNRMGFLIGSEIGEKTDSALKKTQKHFAEISFTKESYFEGGEDEDASFFVVLRTGAENYIKERIQAIQEQEDITDEGFYHVLLGIISGYESEEILKFINNGKNGDSIKNLKVSVYKYMRSKNGPFKGFYKIKLYDIEK